MESTLHDGDILGGIGKRQLAAVANLDATFTFVLGHQRWRKIDALHVPESETVQSVQTIATPAEQFDDLGVPTPSLRRRPTNLRISGSGVSNR